MSCACHTSHVTHHTSPNVSVRQARREEDRVASLQTQDIEEIGGEDADVAAVLRVQVEDEGGPGGAAAAAAAAAKPVHESFHIAVDKVVAGSHEGRVHVTQRITRVVAIAVELHLDEDWVLRHTVVLVAACLLPRHVRVTLAPSKHAHECVARGVADYFPQLGHVRGGGLAKEVVTGANIREMRL